MHALSIGENSVHGSDAPDTAAQEIAQFFSGNEIVGLRLDADVAPALRPTVAGSPCPIMLVGPRLKLARP